MQSLHQITTTVRHLEPENTKAWSDYLASHPSEVLYHRLEWDHVFHQYRLPTIRLVAWRDGRVVGVLPLARQQSWIFGNRLVSLPWFDTAGVLADDEQASESLVGEAIKLAGQQRDTSLLLRQRCPVQAWPQDQSDKVLMRLSLHADHQVLWKGFNTKVRNQVRKAEKSALVAETVLADALPDFFSVYSKNMRDLGSPSHSRRFFQAVLDAFTSDAKLHVVRKGDRVIGAGLTLANGPCLEIPWASSLREFNSLCVNHLLYWHVLQYACKQGYRWFHFGRSSVDSGTFHFKKQWGAEPEPLFWYQFAGGSREPKSTQELQKEFDWAAKIWRKLPLWLTQWLGPRIVSRLP